MSSAVILRHSSKHMGLDILLYLRLWFPFLVVVTVAAVDVVVVRIDRLFKTEDAEKAAEEKKQKNSWSAGI